MYCGLSAGRQLAAASQVHVVTVPSHSSHRGFMESTILLWCVTVRVIQVLLLQTYFNPDEYWQCLEVAHHLAFGYVT